MYLARQLLAELSRHPRRNLDERFEVYAGLVAHAAKQVDALLGSEVPDRPQSEGAAPVPPTEVSKTVASDRLLRSHTFPVVDGFADAPTSWATLSR